MKSRASMANFLTLVFLLIRGRFAESFVLEGALFICQTIGYFPTKWLVPSREEHRLRVFENRELGRIFGP